MKIKLENIIFVAFFLLLILTIIVKSDYVSEVSERENRALATFPDVSPFHEKFPSRMDRYINDRVGFRFEALALIGKTMPSKARVNFNNKVLVGKDNWLFYNDKNETIKEFQRVDRFTKEQLENIKKTFTEVNEFAKENGILLYIMIPPLKHNIYPEYYVEGVGQLALPSKYDTLKTYISDTDIPLIDLNEALIKNKDGRELFYLSDTHWNYLGAFIGYTTLMNEIKKKFSSLNIYKIDDFNYGEEDNLSINPGNDLIKMMGTIQHKYEEYGTLIPKDDFGIKYIEINKLKNGGIERITENRKINGPKAYIVHDSFFEILPYIRNSFSRTVSKWEWGVSPMKYKDEILKEKPDILIWELHERYLSQVIK